MFIKLLLRCWTVDFTSVDTRSSDREAVTFSRMHEITSSYQRSTIYQKMLEKTEQSLQRARKPPIPFKSKESPNGAAKLEVLLRSVLSESPVPICVLTSSVKATQKKKKVQSTNPTKTYVLIYHTCTTIICFINDLTDINGLFFYTSWKLLQEVKQIKFVLK